ncbi:DUF418 domain-containing protein [Rubritalea marina]|uniref:DUF418 domain-containing protein n=1 Tax=Rubritalea marina TaxID=361055 RepID=UPI00037A2103|nr:DUF418 domain-containing protein [Rubritalea marina]
MSQQRISIIDAIRGMAVFGILLANIQSWSGYKFVPFEVHDTQPLHAYDHYFKAVHQFVVDGKFYAIFSILFGAGFAIQFVKNQERMDPFLQMYRRRLKFLLMFGLLHTVVWSGDILTLYALLAFVLVAIRDIPYRWLLPTSIFLLSLFALTHLIVLFGGLAPEPIEQTAYKTYPDIDSVSYMAIFTDGSVVDVFKRNWENVYYRWADMLPNGRVSRVLGFFMLGFYMMRSGFFTKHIYKWSVLLGSLVVGSVLTFIVSEQGTSMASWSTTAMDAWFKILVVGAQIALAIGYMCILAQIYQRPIGEKLLWPLTAIGRMAFTNYLSQTLIGILLFYGFAGGLYGKLSLTQLYMLAVLIYSAQVLFSSCWAKFFKQGPVEWLWKCLTTGKWTSNRKQVQVSQAEGATRA